MERPKRPTTVVQVKLRINRNQIHIGIVIRIQSSDVSPVIRESSCRVFKRPCVDSTVINDRRNDIFPKVAMTFWHIGVSTKMLKQKFCFEDINPHRRHALFWVARNADWLTWLFCKVDNSVFFVNLHDTKPLSFFNGNGNATDRAIGIRLDMICNKATVVHLVNVISA